VIALFGDALMNSSSARRAAAVDAPNNASATPTFSKVGGLLPTRAACPVHA
jgi:hypothetical protein